MRITKSLQKNRVERETSRSKLTELSRNKRQSDSQLVPRYKEERWNVLRSSYHSNTVVVKQIRLSPMLLPYPKRDFELELVR